MLAPVVVEAFPAWVESFEGRTPWMYLDRDGTVTTAVGTALFSAAAAQALPWVRRDGSPASRDEISASYEFVHSRQDLRGVGGESKRFAELTIIRLTEASIDAIVRQTMVRFAAALATQLRGFAAWPPAAQFGALSMAWGMGPMFPSQKFPLWSKAAVARDWERAAIESHESNGVPSRNAANAELFRVAARVERGELPPDALTGGGAGPAIVGLLVLAGFVYAMRG